MLNIESPFENVSDVKDLRFEPNHKPCKYGNGRETVRSRVYFWQGKNLVGASAEFECRTQEIAEVAAKKYIQRLRKHRLIVVPVTKSHIERGVGRSCGECAISLALADVAPRIVRGYSKFDGPSFRVSTYGAWIEGEGIQLTEWSTGHMEIAKIPVDQIPEIVIPYKRNREQHYAFEGMAEWTMDWDNWKDSLHMTLKEWREERGYTDGERPYKPTSCSFVLDLDAFTMTGEPLY